MKTIFFTLLIALSILNLDVYSEEEDKQNLKLSEKQKLAEEIIEAVWKNTKIKWINSYTMEVHIDPERYDFLNETELKKQTKEDANFIADQVYEFTDDITCVKIIHPSHGEMAYTCKGNTPS